MAAVVSQIGIILAAVTPGSYCAGVAVPVAEPVCGVGVKEACVVVGNTDVVAVQVVGAFLCVAGVADRGADVAVLVAVVQYGGGCGAADNASPLSQ